MMTWTKKGKGMGRFALGGGALAVSFLLAGAATAQLTDSTQTTPSVPGGQIGRSFTDQVGPGQGDEFTPFSSVYLIKRDPARSIRRGRQIFQRKFTENQGQGPRVNNDSSGDIVANRALGAGLMDSCAGCHGRPRGSAGHGGDVATRPDSRDSPQLFALGLVEQIAEEITADLRQQEADAIDAAMNGSPPVLSPLQAFWCAFFNNAFSFCQPDPPGPRTVQLESKGVSYGELTAFADGSVDTSGVEGVDPDLRVKPFFAQGGTITMREFIVGAFKAEMGMESTDEVLCDVADGIARTSPAGFVFDPALDTFEVPPDCDDNDADGDGVFNEIPTAAVDHFEFYLLNYFRPGQGKQTFRTGEGLDLMHLVGCTDCHRQNMQIDSDRRVADVDTKFDPINGIFNRLFATATTRFVAVDDDFVDPNDGLEHPLLLPDGSPFLVENIFADFKRHDLGPSFHEREYDDVLTAGATRVTEFMTEPLWGVATTAPYGHDGRSINLEEVILRHGGEAQSSRDAFAALSPDKQRKILEFLGTLILFPPDDTASNLNPGNPGTADPQTPSEHGSINLGALFQLAYEGGE